MAEKLKRFGTVLGIFVLLSYVIYQIVISSYSPIKTETVELYDEYETIDTQGLIVRNETLIPMQTNDFVYYLTENGSRVSKDGRIADLYTDSSAAVAQQQITALDEQIAQLQSIQEQGENNRTNLDIINTQLKKTQAELIAETSSPSFNQIDTLASELLTLMNKQQITIGRDTNLAERIAELTAQKNALLATDTTPNGSVYSPMAGYFVNAVDGYESAIDTDTILSITTDGVRQAMAFSPTINADGYIGKVVGSYEWYLVCVLPSENMTQLALDSRVRLRLPFVSNETIPVTLVAENRDRNGDVAVVFRCDYMSAVLSDIRLEQVQILVKQHSGLRVPDDAVRFNDEQEAGVFVQEGNMLVFRHIKVKYHSESSTYSICEVVTDEESKDKYLQVYDDVVVEGKRLYDGKIVQ